MPGRVAGSPRLYRNRRHPAACRDVDAIAADCRPGDAGRVRKPTRTGFPAASSISSTEHILTRGRPCSFPRAVSTASILRHPASSTQRTPRPVSRSPRSAGSPALSAAARASSLSAAPAPAAAPAAASAPRPAPASANTPASRSSTMSFTVAAASALLVPITPDGPRFAHPTTYSPGTAAAPSRSVTRPPSFGTIPRRSSKAMPGTGSPV